MRNYTKELKDDIQKFILSNNSIQHRTNLLNEILEDYFTILDDRNDDMIQEYIDYMVPIMEVIELWNLLNLIYNLSLMICKLE